MATSLLSWVSNKIGVDITGENEFRKNQKMEPPPEPQQHQTPQSFGGVSAAHRAAAAESAGTKTAPTQNAIAATVTSDHPQTLARIAELRRELDRLTDERDKELEKEKKKKLNASESPLQAAPPREKISDDRKKPTTQYLTLTPSKLFFPTPLDKYIMNTLQVHNVLDQWVTFKIKATSPHRYAVKPRMGLLQPKDNLEVHIILRPTTEAPNTLKDKFLVESRPVTAEELTYVDKSSDLRFLWSTKRDATVGVKIKCRFTTTLPPNFVVRMVSEQPDDDEIPKFDDADELDECEAPTPSPQPAAAIQRTRKPLAAKEQ